MVPVLFLAGAKHVYAGFMSNEHGLPQLWHSASVPVGLSAGDMAELHARVAELPDGWCVERCDACEGHEGEQTALLMLESDLDVAPTFVVYREAERVCLDVCRDDSCARLGSYGTIAQAVQAVAGLLARMGARSGQ